MKEIHQESSFVRDLKKIKKRCYPIEKMETVLIFLLAGGAFARQIQGSFSFR